LLTGSGLEIDMSNSRCQSQEVALRRAPPEVADVPATRTPRPAGRGTSQRVRADPQVRARPAALCLARPEQPDLPRTQPAQQRRPGPRNRGRASWAPDLRD